MCILFACLNLRAQLEHIEKLLVMTSVLGIRSTSLAIFLWVFIVYQKKKSSRSDQTRFPQWLIVARINDLRMQFDQLITATSRYRTKARVTELKTKLP